MHPAFLVPHSLAGGSGTRRGVRVHGNLQYMRSIDLSDHDLKHNTTCSGPFLQDKDWGLAARLALDLRAPASLLQTVTRACERGPKQSSLALQRVVEGLSDEELRQCLEYVCEWNTNAHNCHAAQRLLNTILCANPPQVNPCPDS